MLYSLQLTLILFLQWYNGDELHFVSGAHDLGHIQQLPLRTLRFSLTAGSLQSALKSYTWWLFYKLILVFLV